MIFSFLILFLFSFFLASPIFADGMIIRPNPYGDRWDFSDEQSQQAFINYENGVERLILSIDVQESSQNNLFWIFPVPADPREVSIDVIDSTPKLQGEDISKLAKRELVNVKDILLATQIYTLPFFQVANTSIILPKSSEFLGPGGLSIPEGDDYNAQDVAVFEHIEKEGIASEIITAKTPESLFNYLKDKNLNISEDSIPVFKNYIGKDYSFVVSTIKPDITKLQKEIIRNWLVSYFQAPNYYPVVDKIVTGISKRYPEFEEILKDKGPESYPKNADYFNLQADPKLREEVIERLVPFVEDDPTVFVSRKEIMNGIMNYYLGKQDLYPKLHEIISTFSLKYPEFKDTIESYSTYHDDRFNKYLENNPSIREELIGVIQNNTEVEKEIIRQVFGWISDMYDNENPELMQRIQPGIKQRGLLVIFRTNKIYYPLLPTSVYGSKIVPTTIRVVGYKSPDVFKDIESFTKVNYYSDKNYQNNSYDSTQFKNFYSGELKDIKYTKIEINAPSKFLSEDLWIGKLTPLQIIYSNFASEHTTVNYIFLSILISFITGALTGFLVFKEARRKRGLLKFGILGLANCLTLILLIIATLFTKTKGDIEAEKENSGSLNGSKLKGYSYWIFIPKDNRKFLFIPLFSVFYLIISYFFIELLQVSI